MTRLLVTQSRWLRILSCAIDVKCKMRVIDGSTPIQNMSPSVLVGPNCPKNPHSEKVPSCQNLSAIPCCSGIPHHGPTKNKDSLRL